LSTRLTTTAVSLIAAALTLTACSTQEAELPVSTPTAETQTEEPAEPTPAPEPTEEARGTRQNPLAPGEARLIGVASAFTVSGGTTTFDAWPQIQAENQFNDPPVEGRQFVLFPISVAVDWTAIEQQADENGTDIAAGINPYWVLSVKFVGNDGTSYGSGPDDYCGVVPGDWLNIQPVFDSTTVTGNVCVSVPADKIEGGTWAVTNSTNDAVFVSAIQ